MESPERSNGVFKPTRKWQSLSGLVLGSIHLSLQNTITPVMGLQILSPSRILLYQRRASFKITMLRLVNSSFKLLFGFVGKSLWFTLSQKETCLDFCTARFIKPNRNPVYKCTGLRQGFKKWAFYVQNNNKIGYYFLLLTPLADIKLYFFFGYREIFFKPGFHAVCYIGTMPQWVQIETWCFKIINCITLYTFN